MVHSLSGNILNIGRCLYVLLILVLRADNFRATSLLSGSDACQKCKIENRELADIFEMKEEVQNVRQKCVYVKQFLRCAEPLESKCRQDLNFQGALTLMRSFKEEKNCASMNITWKEGLGILTEKVVLNITKKDKCSDKRPSFRPVYKICGLFGDPHLRTFSNKRHTCSVPGAWPLFANRYLTVQVTNIPLENSSRATATSKVTVIVRGLKRKCIEEKTYQARSFSLPKHFSDGTKRSGDKDCPTTVKQLKKGRRILINICPLKTKIIIRQVEKYLIVHMRVPEDLTRRKTIGLCQRGCPRIEQINLDKMNRVDKVIASLYKKEKLTKRVKRQRQERARKLCGAAKVTGFYYKSCLFDMLTSDDASFVKAARKAMKDFRSINKDDDGKHIVKEAARHYRTRPTKAIKVQTTSNTLVPSSAGSIIHKNSFLLAVCIHLLLLYR